MTTVISGATFSCPEFLAMERVIIEDFVDCTRECCDEAEACVKALNKHGGSEYIHRLFRSLHSLKGNCQMVGLTPFSTLLHKIEEIFSLVRAHPERYFPELGEFLLLATDEVENLLTELVSQGSTSHLRRQKLYDLCDELQQNSKENLYPEHFRDAIQDLGGKQIDKDSAQKAHKIQLELPPDLEFMRRLALQIDHLSIYRKNRTDQQVQLIEALNEELNFPLDSQQLKAASWMHDVGMSFIPHTIFNKEGSLSKEEVRIIQEHVVIGSQLLLRFGGWDEAARMVLDHHERYDGSGYPNALQGEQIHPGARMLAIVDTFCSITNERSDRSYKKSLLSAISEINANSHIQFDPVMVTAFNDVVRKLLMKL